MNKIVYLFIGIGWVFTNVFFLPFFPWTLGISRPWFINHGYLPYRDFTWTRNPLDIFLLSQWYEIFGAHSQSYQLFILILLLLETFLIFYISYYLLSPRRPLAYFFYIIFLFPLFINTEVGEVIIGILELCALITVLLYLKGRKLLLLLFAGIISGFIYLTKQSSAIISTSILLTILVDSYVQKEFLSVITKKLAVYFLGILITIGILILYFFYNNALSDYIYSTLFFLFGSYFKAIPLISKGNAGLIAAGFISLLVPFVLFWKDIKLKPQQVLFFVLIIFTSLFSLIPSFLSYRAFPSFALIAIVAGYTFSLVLNQNITKVKKLIVALSLILFISFTNKFITEYLQFIFENGFHFKQYIFDYSDDEKNAARWVMENTKENEKIQNFGNEMIYVFSNRLPKHKYIEPFAYVWEPYEKTSQLFISDPPKVVVYDETTPKSPYGIADSSFIQYMKKTYIKKAGFGNLSIYQLENLKIGPKSL